MRTSTIEQAIRRDEPSPMSPREVAQRIWGLYRDTGADAITAGVDMLECDSDVRQALREYMQLLLDQCRRDANAPVYRRAATLAERLVVEAPPAGYKQPNESVAVRVSSMDMVMTGDDQGKGYSGRVPLAALRALLDIRLPNRRRVKSCTRNELIRQIGVMEAQANGTMKHAAQLRGLVDVMRPHETGLTAIRRLERE